MIEGTAALIAATTTVFGWAFFSFWSSIPAGIALNLTPVLVALTATVSYGAGAALVIIVGAPLRDRIQGRLEARQAHQAGDEAPQPNRMLAMVRSAWDRFGLIGLSLLAPMTVGSQAGAVIGLSLGVRPLPLVIGLTLGAAAWSIAITLAVVLGLMAVTPT